MEAATIRVPRRRGSGRVATASDEQLVARVRAGEDRAFEVLYDRHAGSLLAFCRHMLGSREEAEDALQHVLVSAYRELRGANPPARVKPWLYAVARNRCVSLLRQRRDAVSLDATEAAPVVGAGDVAHSVQDRQELRQVLDDIAALPDDQRTALVLAEVGALSHDEIALALDVRKDKVKALVFQARRSLMSSREARDTSCQEIQQQLSVLRGGALRRNPIRRHVATCPACSAFKREVERQRSALAAALPVLPAVALKDGILAAAFSGGAGAAGAGIASGGAAAGGVTAATAAAAPAATTATGLMGAASSGLLTKALATLTIAAAGGAGAVTVHEVRHTSRAPSAPIAAPTPASVPARPAAAVGRQAGVTTPRPAAPSGNRARGAGNQKHRVGAGNGKGRSGSHRPAGAAAAGHRAGGGAVSSVTHHTTAPGRRTDPPARPAVGVHAVGKAPPPGRSSASVHPPAAKPVPPSGAPPVGAGHGGLGRPAKPGG